VYFVSGMDTSNITLVAEQFETIEEALERAREIEKTGALADLFQDENPAPIMDFTQVSAWCRANSQQGDQTATMPAPDILRRSFANSNLFVNSAGVLP
jgi:hypothetical protein